MAAGQATIDTERLASLCELLRARLPQLEQATLARAHGISDPASVDDPEYVSGLREAVAAGLAYGVAGLEASADRLPPVPPQLTDQARFAARNGVSLDTVLRRYFAGYVLLGDFVIQIAEGGEFSLSGAELQRAWRSEAALFDGLVAAVADTFAEEIRGRVQSSQRRRVEQVRRLLAGELLDVADLRHDLDRWHLGIVASGLGAPAALRDLAAALGTRLLLVRPDAQTVWAWLGGRSRIDVREALRLASSSLPTEISLACGDPGEGVEGWRLTHRQAKAAFPVALRTEPRIVCYTDVALLASAMHDKLLAHSLKETYLAPLTQERDGGEHLRQTLRAYFMAGQNVSATAAALGTSRKTVNARLQVVEERVGRTLDACAAEIRTALRLEELAHFSSVA
jgi:hypothetical protein